MVAAEPAPHSALDLALAKVARCEPFTEREAELVKASMPEMTTEDLTTGDEVDPDAFLAYLRGECAQEPCAAA
jgi:hypothetical protein